MSRFGVGARSVRVLRWPLGFRAGLAISNDAEYLTLDGLMTLDGLFSEVLGPGVFSTSAFLLNPNTGNPGFSLFAPHGSITIQDGMKALLHSGLIDGVHALVDNDQGNADMVRVRSAVAHLSSQVRLNWWSNHGGIENHQNIGHEKMSAYQEGDLVTSPFYSIAMAKSLGVRYFALDDNNHLKLWGQHSKTFGQVNARDGSHLVVFHRYRGLRGMPAPTLESLPMQVTPRLIESLLRRRLGVIVYQHLGIASRRGREVSAIVSSGADVPPKAADTLRMLADAKGRGLWLARTSEFLDFLWTRKKLKLTVRGSSLFVGSDDSDSLKLDNIALSVGTKLRRVEFDGGLMNWSSEYLADFVRLRGKVYVVFRKR